MNFLLEKLEDCPRCGASGPDWNYDMQHCKCMDRATIRASIETPLRDCIEIAPDGWVSFCYPYRVGVYIANTRRALELVKEAGRGSARYRKIALREAEEHLAGVLAEDDLIHKQWDAYIEARRKVSL